MLLQKYKENVRVVKEEVRKRSPLVVTGLILAMLGAVGSVGLGQLPIDASNPNQPQTDPEGRPADPPGGSPSAPPAVPGWDYDEAYEVTNQSPSAPGSGVFSESFTGKVGVAGDAQYLTTALSNTDGGWDGQVYKFKIANPEAGFGRITVRWTGYGEEVDGYPVTLELYNHEANRWELPTPPGDGQTQSIGTNIVVDLDLVDSFGSYVDTDGSFWVRVRALNLELVAPSNLVATVAASNEVRLSWNDNASSETGYVVERVTAGTGEILELKKLPPNYTAYTDYDPSWGSLVPGGKYMYRVYAAIGTTRSTPAQSPQVQLPAKGNRNAAIILVPRDVASIQEALNLAQGDDTVLVAAGTYSEAVVVRTPKVTLAGAGVGKTTIAVPAGCAGQYCGGITIETGSSLESVVRDLSISDGQGNLVNGDRYGGGLFIKDSAAILSRLTIFRSTLAGRGVGSAIAMLNPRVVTVDNVAAMLNLGAGAAVYVSGAGDGVVFRHVTLSGNGSDKLNPAAGLWVEESAGAVDVVNSILWQNSYTEPEVASDAGSSIVRVANTIIGPISAASPSSGGVRGPQLINVANSNPKFVSYQDPHLQADSPAIDFGDPASGTTYDYENVARPQGSRPDAGASEYLEAKSGGGKKAAALFAPQPTVRIVPAPRPHASLNTDKIELIVELATPPAAPSDPAVVAFTADRISISFVDNSLDEDGFIVHRRLGDEDRALAPIAAHDGTGEVVFPDYGADLPSGRLAPGTTYCYSVVAYRGSASAESGEVCQQTSGTPGLTPAVPSNLAAEGLSAGQIRLTWTDNASNEEGFVLYRKLQGSADDFAIISPPAVANATSYVDSGGDTEAGILQSGATYCYRVAAYNVHGVSAAWPTDRADGVCVATPHETWVEVFEGSGAESNRPTLAELGELRDFQFQGENDAVELETRLADLFESGDAYNWQVFAVHLDTPPAGLTSLTLRWRGRGEDQPNYPVRFSLYNFSTGSWTHQRVFNDGTDEEGDVRAPNDDAPNTLFTFTLTSAQLANAFSGTVGTHANTVLLWVRARAYIPAPTPPENLRAYPDPAPTTVYLAWDDRSTNETGFEVQRSPALYGPLPVDPSWETVRITAAGVTTYSESLPVASSFMYRVRAMRVGIGSDFTPYVTVDTPLYAPYLLNVVANGSDSIKVSWLMNPSNGTRFPLSSYVTEVYRARGTTPFPMDWELIGNTAGGAVAYTDVGLEPDTTYSYRTRFVVRDGSRTRYSVDSSQVYTKTTKLAVPPAPQDLAAMPVSTSQINLSWKDVDGELAYDLERQNSLTGVWQTVDANIPPDTTSMADVGLVPGLLYRYRIRAKNAVGFSTYSNVAEAATFFASDEQWDIISQLPSRSGLMQGVTVLASHGGYLYAASNDAPGQGKATWFHLNVWRSTDGGNRDSWEWVGQTATDVENNVPVAMASFNGKLFLLTASRLWSSSGSTWSEALGQGVGDAESSGFFSHMTVYNGRLFVLVQDGSVFYTDTGTSWIKLAAAPANITALAQYEGALIAAASPIGPKGGGALRLDLYRSFNGDIWEPLGGIVGEDASGRCDSYVGVMGLGGSIFIGARDAVGQPCLWESDDGQSWSQTGDVVNIWAALPSASAAYVATTARYPEPLAARIDAATGNVALMGTPGLNSGYRIWSVANHGAGRFAAAIQQTVAAGVPEVPIILRLSSS